MLLHAIVAASRANGPGLRAVVWFQGCSLNCKNCFNPDTHRFEGKDAPPSEVAEAVSQANATEPIEGVTFSGGEPMQQAADLLELIEELRNRDRQLSFGLFTGYTERELVSGRYFCISPQTIEERRELWNRIRQRLDFAVMGRYNQHRPASAPLCSSGNQRLRLLSGRYGVRDFAPLQMEITITDGGLAQLTGFPILGDPL
jgi:anaerobic ribonucleoside-triphosphate reductase activating protein